MSKRAESKSKIQRRKKSELKVRMTSFLMFLPNLVRLLGRLLKDSRVPTPEKALFIAAIVYVISPLDLIPDIFPFIGQVDDLYVVALTLLRLVNRTDGSVVRQHWAGGGDIVALAGSIADLAPKFLPRRVSRVLTAKVELAPAGQILNKIANRQGAVLKEESSDDLLDLSTPARMPN